MTRKNPSYDGQHSETRRRATAALCLAAAALLVLPGCGTVLTGAVAYLLGSVEEVTEYDDQPGSTLITAVDPASGSEGGGTRVTVYGLGFESGCTVQFGAAAAADVAWISPTQVRCTAPAGTAGPATVTVLNPGGSSGSLDGGFTYVHWWNPAWSARQPVTVTNAATSGLSDVQVRVDLTYDAAMRSDFSDLRFTCDDAGTEQEIPYWTETVAASTDASFWVRVPAVPASGSVTLHAYFGNPSAASASDFDAVFAKSPGAPGLLAEWHFDEGAGATAADSSGNAHHGDLLHFLSPAGWLLDDGGGWGTRADAGFAEGSALLFDGADDVVNAGSGASLSVSAAFTVEAWARSDEPAAGGVDRDLVSRWRVDPDGFRDETRWSAYDPSSDGVGTTARGFAGCVSDGRYLYFTPYHDTGTWHGEFLRCDTHAAFDDDASWTAYDPGADGVGTDPDGYMGGSFDGRYVYFAPYYNGTDFSGEILRYDTQAAFDAAASWSVFDPGAPRANPWSSGTAITTNTRDAALVEAGGMLYHVGGSDGISSVYNTVLEYDPATTNWTPVTPLPANLHEHAAAVWNGKVYVTGGSTSWASASASNVDTLYEYDPASNTWDTSRSVMPGRRDSHGMAALDGKLYVLGGNDPTATRMDTFWEYNIATDTWTPRAVFPDGIAEMGCCAAGGRVYAISGQPSAGGNSPQVWAYDPSSDTWTRKEDIPNPRRHVKATPAGGNIYTFGGYMGGAVGRVDEYDPALDAWTEKTSFVTGRWDHATALLGTDIFVAGGNTGSSAVSSVEIYDPSQESPLGDAEGYRGTVFDGRHVYFVPNRANTDYGCVVLRYDTTAPFDDYASYEAFDPEHHGAGPTLRGYFGAVYTGSHIYFVPFYNSREGYSGRVLRYDKGRPFGEPDAWESFDPGSQGLGVAPQGYAGGTFDGRHVYFAPYYNGAYHGEVLRFDTRGAFRNVGDWEVFDAAASGAGNVPGGFFGAAFDGTYVYLVPRRGGQSGEFWRYDPREPFGQASSWSTFDVGVGVGDVNQGYHSAFFDGRYLYCTPYDSATLGSNHGEVMRFDTAGEDAAFRTGWSRAPHGGGFASGPAGFWAQVSTDAGFFRAAANTAPCDGDWHHLAVTYDGSALTLYIDGSAAASAPATGAVRASTADLLLGSFQDGRAPYRGALDAVRLYDRALSADELAASAQRRAFVSPEPTVTVGATETR